LSRIVLCGAARPYRVLFAVFRSRPKVQLRTNPFDPASPYHQPCGLLVYGISSNDVVEDQGLARRDLLPEVCQERTLSSGLIHPPGFARLWRSGNVETLLVTQALKLVLPHPSIRSRTTGIRRKILSHRRQITELQGIAVLDPISIGRKRTRVAGTRRLPVLQIRDQDS